jgi:hypothetical protein
MLFFLVSRGIYFLAASQEASYRLYASYWEFAHLLMDG